MRDRSKKLLVINTGKKESGQTRLPAQSGTTHIIGGGGLSVNMSDYLLKSIWDKVWEIRTDSQGIEYIFGKMPVVTQYGITMYSGDGVDVPSLASGLPFDGRTIWYNPDTNQIEVIGGTGGGSGEGVSNFWDLSGIPSWITNSKPKYTYSEIEGTPDLSGFATQNWIISQGYASAEELKKYIPISGYTEVSGEKNFTGGLKVNGSPIYYDSAKKYWKLEGDLLVTGGVTMYGSDSSFVPSTIMDAILYDSATLGINSNGQLYVKGGTSGGGSGEGVSNFWDLSGIPSWITNSKPKYSYSEIESTPDLTQYALVSQIPSLSGYATESWVLGKGYALNSDLTLLATKVNNFLEGSDTDTIINKWKELEAFLSGLSESDNLAEILETKANKSYVDSTFITIAGSEDVTGIHDFKNGLKVGGMKLSKSQDDVVYLDGNLVVRGGLTMYALDDVTVDSIIDKLPTASTNSKGIASFDEDDFTIEDGHVSLNDDRLSSELSELKDVEVLNPQNNESLVYNSETAKWENKVVDSDKTFYYEQQTSSDTWNINHNLSKKPSVMVFDSANDEVHGDIFYNDNNRITLSFSSPFSGVAILN